MSDPRSSDRTWTRPGSRRYSPDSRCPTPARAAGRTHPKPSQQGCAGPAPALRQLGYTIDYDGNGAKGARATDLPRREESCESLNHQINCDGMDAP
jgi:hypothetical protein